MSAHLLEYHQLIPGTIDRVLAFFEDPLNLEKITPPFLHFEVVSASDTRVEQGTEIEYRLRWHLLPMRWKSRISEYEQGVHFADEMLSGPYRHWYHRHHFAQTPQGVEMSDRVEYELPFGVMGEFVHNAIVRRQLESIFDYRREAIARIFAPTETRAGS